jgi:DegV family protein with EDD domain
VAVVLSKALSGTYLCAERESRTVGEGRVVLVDSRGASLTEGMLVLRGLDLAREGWEPGAIAQELVRVRDQSGGFFTADNLERLIRSGRVGRLAGWLGTKLNVKPIIALTRDGRAEPVARARGREAARTRILHLLDAVLTPRPALLRLGVAHGDIPEFAAELRDELQRRYAPKELFVSPITPVIAAHAGIGAWGVFYQVEDGTKR